MGFRVFAVWGMGVFIKAEGFSVKDATCQDSTGSDTFGIRRQRGG